MEKLEESFIFLTKPPAISNLQCIEWTWMFNSQFTKPSLVDTHVDILACLLAGARLRCQGAGLSHDRLQVESRGDIHIKKLDLVEVIQTYH